MTSHVENDVILTCDVCSHPPASYSWKRNGEIIEGETNKQFQIEKITMATLGNYTCVAENKIRNNAYKREFVFDLTLKGPQHKPTNLQVMSKTSAGVCLNSNPGFDGGQGMTLDPGNEIVSSSDFPVTNSLDGKTTSYHIPSLRSNTTYGYNNLSNSPVSVIEITTRGMNSLSRPTILYLRQYIYMSDIMVMIY